MKTTSCPIRPTIDRVDVGVRQLDAGVEGDDLRIVPLLDRPEIDLGDDRAGQLELGGLDTGDVDGRTTPPITVGNWIRPLCCRSSPFSGASVAPNATVFALIWRMPPPNRFDW